MSAPQQQVRQELDSDTEWQRLDLRMLLVHPIRELIRFLPVLLAIVVAGASGGRELWQLLGVAVPIALGLLRYLTTSFRIASGRVELKRGLVNRHVQSTPVDRVRTVDLTSSPIHRLLGLTTVRLGTGVSSGDREDRLDLDGLPVDRARRLRQALLGAGASGIAGADATAGAAADLEVVRLDLGWLRFAPFTSSGLIIAAAALGALNQLVNTLGGWQRLNTPSVADRGATVPLPLLVLLLIGGAVAVLSVLAIGGYLMSNWGFRLTRSPDGDTWRLSRGLLTTRETTLDDDRVAGVTLAEPIGLRLVRGARLSAIVTGFGRKQRSSSALLPPAPLAVAARVAALVIDAAEPVSTDLVRHGRRASLRRWSRALVPALVVAAAAAVGTGLGGGRWLLLGLLAIPLAALLAADRSRALGHALAAGYLVSRSGSLVRRRRMLAVDHVIGWTFRSTWFQRRAGLTTLVATTAGGPQTVPVPDVPEDVAVALAATAIPDLLAPFTRSGGEPTARRRTPVPRPG